MKRYTQTEFDAFERDENGWKICPTGDYTEIVHFSERCVFGERCRFGERCVFSERCSFGAGCRFSEWCVFGAGCRFGEWCVFGAGCRFGEWCGFGMGCVFGEWCVFGAWCRFSEWCVFGAGCSHEGLKNSKYFACDRIGREQRKTYFFKADDGLYVRAGCFFGTLDEFIARVKKVHGGTRYKREYLAAAKLARIVLKDA